MCEPARVIFGNDIINTHIYLLSLNIYCTYDRKLFVSRLFLYGGLRAYHIYTYIQRYSQTVKRIQTHGHTFIHIYIKVYIYIYI